MPMLLTNNTTCELGLPNGTLGIFESSNIIYTRKALYALAEINTSQVETNFDGLRSILIPILLAKKKSTVPIKQLFPRPFEGG